MERDRVIIKIDGDDSSYEKELNNLISNTNKKLSNIAKKGAATAAAIAGAVATAGIAYNSQMEQYEAGFATMLGSVEKAKAMIADLKDFAAKTPFEMGDLAGASTTLLSFGQNAEELQPTLKMLGDIALGNKEKFNSLALVYGQVQSQGKLMGQDLLQMINSGFNPLNVIAQKTGKSMSQLKDEMSKGQISFEMVKEAMESATSEGGMFFNAMETQSKTLSGQWSTLQDNAKALAGELSKTATDALTNNFLPALNETAEKLTEMAQDGSLQDNIKDTTTVIVACATAWGTFVVVKTVTTVVLGATVAFQKATLQISLYSAQLGVAKISELSHLSALSAKEIIVGVLTGKIKLATAAQAAWKAITDVSTGGLTLLISVIGAAVAGIAAFALNCDSASNRAREQAKALKELEEQYRENIKQIDETQKSEEAQAQTANVLKNKLYELEDQVKSGTLTDQEAQVAKENFAAAGKELEKLIPGITAKLYDETGAIDIQRISVDKLTASYQTMMIAKSMANAYQSKMDEASKQKVEAQKIMDEIDASGDAKTTKMLSGKRDANGYRTAKEVLIKTGKNYENAKEAWKEADNEVRYLGEQMIKELAEVQKQNEILTEELGDNGEKQKTTYTSTATTAKKAAKETTKTEEDEFKKRLKNSEKYIEDRNFYNNWGADNEIAARKRVLNNLDDMYEQGLISYEEYAEEYENQSKKIYTLVTENIETAFKEIAESAEKNLEDVNKSIETMQKKLSDYGSLTNTVTIKGIGENNDTLTYTKLADLSKQTQELEEYADMLDAIKQRSNVPKEFMSVISQMSIEEGTKFGNALLGASDEEFNEYINEWTKKQEAAERIANEYYSEEKNKAEETLNEVRLTAQDIKTILLEEGYEVSDEYLNIGKDSALNFEEGFLGQISLMIKKAKKMVENTFASFTPVISVAGAGAVSNTTTSYYDNRSTTINAGNNASAHEIVEAQNQQSLYESHTKGWE